MLPDPANYADQREDDQRYWESVYQPRRIHTMTEEHMQEYERLCADFEYFAWAKAHGLRWFKRERWHRQVAYNTAVNACTPPLTDAELMASDPAKLSPSDYNRYMRRQGFWWYGHGGY